MVAPRLITDAPGDLLPDADGEPNPLPPLKIPSSGWAAGVAERNGTTGWPRHKARARRQRKAAAARRREHTTPQSKPDARPVYNPLSGKLVYPRSAGKVELFASGVARDAQRAAAGEVSAVREGDR